MSVAEDVRSRPPVSGLRRRHVLRLCSVYEVVETDLAGPAARFDPIGGMQNHVAALSRCLDEQGVVQTVVTSRLGARTGRTPLGRHGTVVRVGVHLPRLRQLWAVCAVPAVMRARSVDVVHAHQGEDVATLVLARLAARLHRCPLVVTLHLSERHTLTGRSPRALLLHRVGGALERAALQRAAAVITLAERTARLVRADGVPAERVHTVPSGFEPAVFRPAPDAPAAVPPPARLVDGGRPRIGYVGRLAPQKRPDLVLRAFELLHCPAHLVVVGDGPERHRVQVLAERSTKADCIELSGFVPHDSVPAVLRSLDLLVLPSAYEELGSVLVEAMAVGLPVVASRTGGIPEVVADGRTGLLVPPGDERALAAAIDRVLADPGLAGRLRAGARERSRDWSWPVLAERVADVYDRVAGRPVGS